MTTAKPLILHGGTILTMDPARPRVEAVGVEGNRIIATGELAQVRAAIQRDAELIDLGKRTLVPGFVDAHNHYFATAESFAGVEARGVRSIEELSRRIEERVRRTRPGAWIRGSGLEW